MVLFEGKPFSTKELRARATKYAYEIARKAKQIYAPIGWTGDLRRGIKVQSVRMIGDDVEIVIVSGAPYSWDVHNTPKRHTQYPGGKWISFGDIAPPVQRRKKGEAPEGAEARYWRGFAWAVENSRFVRYAASFFTDAADDARRNDYDKIMGPSLRK